MKEYKTAEECLKINGEHAWKKVLEHVGMSCDGHCDWNDPKEKCYHCPAKRAYRRTQAPNFEWVDETPNNKK